MSLTDTIILNILIYHAIVSVCVGIVAAVSTCRLIMPGAPARAYWYAFGFTMVTMAAIWPAALGEVIAVILNEMDADDG